MAAVDRPREVDPGVGPAALLRAVAPSVPVVRDLPGLRKEPGPFRGLALRRAPVTVDRDHARAYAEVGGFPVKDTVPVTYPHLLAFPLHRAILTDRAFPWPAMGTVHVANVLTAHRHVLPGEVLDVTVRAEPERQHPRGTTVDLVAEVRAGGTTVWTSTSTYLRRGRGTEGAEPAGPAAPDPVPGTVDWRLPGDVGRRYAAVSGDWNPIHLYPWTARPLGFPRQIAHGMWSTARCVAALENRLPERVTIDVVFRTPVLLPSTVSFGFTRDAGTHTFSLTRPRDGRPHLLGRAHAA
jgi:acyl dehydratase